MCLPPPPLLPSPLVRPAFLGSRRHHSLSSTLFPPHLLRALHEPSRGPCLTPQTHTPYLPHAPPSFPLFSSTGGSDLVLGGPNFDVGSPDVHDDPANLRIIMSVLWGSGTVRCCTMCCLLHPLRVPVTHLLAITPMPAPAPAPHVHRHPCPRPTPTVFAGIFTFNQNARWVFSWGRRAGKRVFANYTGVEECF